jgi:hypothetical protein
VKILLDECVDWRLSRDLAAHEVKTARQMGWVSIKNGELLALAAAEFDAFVTVDRNLSFQQKLPGLQLAIIVLRSKSNRLADREYWCRTFYNRSKRQNRVLQSSSVALEGQTSLTPTRASPRSASAAAWASRCAWSGSP